MQEASVNIQYLSQSCISSQSISSDLLSELGRATTAYHEALPDRAELARQEYEEALRKFNATRS